MGKRSGEVADCAGTRGELEGGEELLSDAAYAHLDECPACLELAEATFDRDPLFKTMRGSAPPPARRRGLLRRSRSFGLLAFLAASALLALWQLGAWTSDLPEDPGQVEPDRQRPGWEEGPLSSPIPDLEFRRNADDPTRVDVILNPHRLRSIIYGKANLAQDEALETLYWFEDREDQPHWTDWPSAQLIPGEAVTIRGVETRHRPVLVGAPGTTATRELRLFRGNGFVRSSLGKDYWFNIDMAHIAPACNWEELGITHEPRPSILPAWKVFDTRAADPRDSAIALPLAQIPAGLAPQAPDKP